MDLLNWERQEKAIMGPSDHESIWSGCCVVDYNNASGQFDDLTAQDDRVVAIYTLHTQGHETQDVAFQL